MPRKAKARKMKKAKKQNKQQKARLARMSPPRAGIPRAMIEAAELVADPCNGPVTASAGISSLGAVVERQRSSITFPASASDTNGYMVWFPSYNGSTGSGLNANVFYWTCINANTGLRPSNTVANPMGTTLASSGQFLADPTAASVAFTSPFCRARCVSACMQFEFLGSLANCAGQVAVIRNLSLSAFNYNSGSALNFQPLSVDEMFAYASTRQRIDLDGTEVVWRPTDVESVLRTSGVDPSSSAFEPDVLFQQGVPTTSATTCANINPGAVTGIAIAWRGHSTGQTHTVNFVKVAELELAPRNNLIEQIPRPMAGGRPTYAKIADYLDSVAPGWQHKAMHTAGKAFKTAVNAYAPRVSQYLRTGMAIRDGSL